MPGPKAQLPAPIDRPLSRAYLRQFTGWSTAYPPGLSDPTSMRTMENVQINRDGSAKVRPGLRFLSYATLPTDAEQGIAFSQDCVGTHEAFFLNDGTKAYLFAVREPDKTVGFRVLVLSGNGAVVRSLAAAGFSVPQGYPALAFTAATTYVKYLQIDNKIFALSNAGETMRLFNVGAIKSAKKPSSITRPEWSAADKLTVVKPDAPWINTGIPTLVRKNLSTNPSFEAGLTGVVAYNDSAIVRNTSVFKNGTASLQLSAKPQRTNLMPRPLHNVAVTGTSGWAASGNAASVGVTTSYMRVTAKAGAAGMVFYTSGPLFDVVPGAKYSLALDLGFRQNVSDFGFLVRFYNSAGVQVGSDFDSIGNADVGRRGFNNIQAPPGGSRMAVYARAARANTSTAVFDIKNVVVAPFGESTSMFTGDSGADYSWMGAPGASGSVYLPPVTVGALLAPASVVAGVAYTASMWSRAGTVTEFTNLYIKFYNAAGTELLSTGGTGATSSTSFVEYSVSETAPAGAVTARILAAVGGVGYGEMHYVDSNMIEKSADAGDYFSGDTTSTSLIKHVWDGAPHVSSSTETTYAIAATIPADETRTANTLLSSVITDNQYNFGYFYTFENELGESAASQVTVVRAKRRWSAWSWNGVDAVGEPNGTDVMDATLAADQLVICMPQAAYDAGKALGATKWNLYMLTWSNEDTVPVDGLLIESKPITAAGDYGREGWVRQTPATTDAGFASAVPNLASRYNYSAPSSGGQGLVAADRMILVDDPNAQAIIRWSSNLQGEYTNFTAGKGGGYKTLTSGDLYVPVSVKLWQNPQSADTLTILCQGLDGANTAYYMAPASVSQQSEQLTVMGFEETSASPGTVSPFGCEVMNNALYHPLDEMLMKSTASNYNISHKPMTDQIEKSWSILANKHRIVSSQHDNRLYYIVHNPKGAPLEAGCMGNEIWLFDIASEKGTWSRFLIQASSLRRIENGGRIYMSVIRPDGIFFLDPDYDRDDVVDSNLRVGTRFIPWKFETNTQGANRAHDAWAHLQQLTVSFGNLVGKVKYGIRTWDIHGRALQVEKIYTAKPEPEFVDSLPWDVDDHLLIRADLKEWFFYASSVDGELSAGQVDAVQYRYTPSTVNTGYEYGSVETFEYSRAVAGSATQNSDSGVPTPMMDTRRP